MKRINPDHDSKPPHPPENVSETWEQPEIKHINTGRGTWHNTPKDKGAEHPAEGIVFLLDVDNTLLNNDDIEADLKAHLTREFGAENRDRYWSLFEELRAELGYADYLGALQRYRLEDLNDPRLLLMSTFLVDYPFTERLYPGALDVIRHLRRWGSTVILSDGDVVFQPRKVQRSGLWDAVEGHVLIYIHKELMLEEVMQRYPARHYVMVDDKLRVLTAMKHVMSDKLTTVFPRQGHYARDPKIAAANPPAEITINAIGDLVNYTLPVLLGNSATGHVQQEMP
ncbi:MAG: HAD family hydrolase [Gammaproteobacteria bacterium]